MTAHSAQHAAHTIAGLVGREVADCWEAMRLVLLAFGVEAPATAAECLAGAFVGGRCFRRVDPLAARAGDVLVFRDGESDHVGVALDAFRFAHGGAGMPIRIDRTAAWLPRLRFAARWDSGAAVGGMA